MVSKLVKPTNKGYLLLYLRVIKDQGVSIGFLKGHPRFLPHHPPWRGCDSPSPSISEGLSPWHQPYHLLASPKATENLIYHPHDSQCKVRARISNILWGKNIKYIVMWDTLAILSNIHWGKNIKYIVMWDTVAILLPIPQKNSWAYHWTIVTIK